MNMASRLDLTMRGGVGLERKRKRLTKEEEAKEEDKRECRGEMVALHGNEKLAREAVSWRSLG